MQKTKTRTLLRMISLILSLMVLATLLTACSSDEPESGSNYIRVTKDGKKLEMKVMLTETGLDKVGLFALEMWQSPADIAHMTPIAEGKVKDNEVNVKYEISGDLTETLCRGYVLGKLENSGYEAVSGVYYVTNPRSLHNVKSDENAPVGNIKGAIGKTGELLDLGAKSTVVTADLGSLMSAEGGLGKIQYTWNGYSCYVDRAAVEQLDRTVKSYSDAGIYVFLELVQTRSHDQLPDGLKSIAYPGVGGASGYALNMSGRDGAIKICGVLDFLAGRYANGGEYGRAEAFIIGRNVNNYTKFYAGCDSIERTAQSYITAVRAAYNILLSHTPSGRVYVAIDNNWNVANNNARDFMSTLADMSNDGGDFYWQVSVEANASDATLSSIWSDDLAGDQPKFISPANIEVLSNLLSSGQFTCNNMKRNILVNRFAVGGNNEEARAASYAYAFYKCLDAINVDGLIYAKTADSEGEALTNGLLTAESGGKLSERKVIADVFASIDNLADGQVRSIGSSVGSAWDKLYGDHRDDAEKRQVLIIGASAEHSGKKIKIHTDFSGGDTFGFTPAVSAEYVELRYSSYFERPVLYARLSPSSSSEDAGVISGRLSRKELKDAGYIGISAMATASGSDSLDITVRLTGYTKDGTEKVLVCTSRAQSNAWFECYFDISEFVKDINSEEITVAILASSSNGGGRADSIWVSSIVSEGPMQSGIPLWVILLIVGAVLVAGITVFIIWFRKNYTVVKE